MIDPKARDSTATLIRRLASGRLSTADYEVAHALNQSTDEGVRAVLDAGWGLYSDYRTYHLRGSDTLPPETTAAVARCVLFLKTDLEYEWPSLRPSLFRFLLTLMTLGVTWRQSRRRWERSGDYHVWPFRRYSDYKRALGHPPYFVGLREGAA